MARKMTLLTLLTAAPILLGSRCSTQNSPPPTPAAPRGETQPAAPAAPRGEAHPAAPAVAPQVGDSEGDLVLHLADSVDLRLKRIEPGEFSMGSPISETHRGESEGPQHLVRVTRPYYLGEGEVSQAQWMSVMESNPSEYIGADLPVERVNWNQCQEFCRRVSAKVGRSVRLPSEAEWEYACRAGTQTAFGFGTTISTDQANYSGNAMPYADGVHGIYRETTVPIDSLAANAWGLHHMHGNVYEWCEDPWHENYNGAPDNQSPWMGASAVPLHNILRGGSWSDHPMYLRSAARNHHDPNDGGPRSRYGFRVAVDVDQP